MTGQKMLDPCSECGMNHGVHAADCSMRGTKVATVGRAITLDPIMPREHLRARPVRVESSMGAGFRQHWMGGGDDEYEIDMCSGAWMGSKWLTLTVKNKTTGESIDEVIDMEAFVQRWVAAAIKAGPSPKWDAEEQAFTCPECGSPDRHMSACSRKGAL